VSCVTSETAEYAIQAKGVQQEIHNTTIPQLDWLHNWPGKLTKQIKFDGCTLPINRIIIKNYSSIA
jgi:hypothetical protein